MNKILKLDILSDGSVGLNKTKITLREMHEAQSVIQSYDVSEEAILNAICPDESEKDKLIKVLAEKLLQTEFGYCYMCTNPMKNITLDGKNNGCDGNCSAPKDLTVEALIEKIKSELAYKNNKTEIDNSEFPKVAKLPAGWNE